VWKATTPGVFCPGVEDVRELKISVAVPSHAVPNRRPAAALQPLLPGNVGLLKVCWIERAKLARIRDALADRVIKITLLSQEPPPRHL
jgi:hypothetical protein